MAAGLLGDLMCSVRCVARGLVDRVWKRRAGCLGLKGISQGGWRFCGNGYVAMDIKQLFIGFL